MCRWLVTLRGCLTCYCANGYWFGESLCGNRAVLSNRQGACGWLRLCMQPRSFFKKICSLQSWQSTTFLVTFWTLRAQLNLLNIACCKKICVCCVVKHCMLETVWQEEREKYEVVNLTISLTLYVMLMIIASVFQSYCIRLEFQVFSNGCQWWRTILSCVLASSFLTK